MPAQSLLPAYTQQPPNAAVHKLGALASWCCCRPCHCRLFEFAWKGQLRMLYPTVQGYQSVLADVATYTGMLTLASMVVSRLVFQHAGWGVAASVTPAVMGIAGVVFFAGSLAAGLPMLTPEAAATMAGVGATAGVVTQVSVVLQQQALLASLPR